MSKRADILDFSAKRAFPKTEQYGRFVAEFYTNLNTEPPTYHFIITRQGEREILHWGQETSEREAHRAAKIYAHHLLVREEAS